MVASSSLESVRTGQPPERNDERRGRGWRRAPSALALVVAVGWGALGCSGGQSQAQSPNPVDLLEPSDDEVAEASSGEVQKGVDALRAQNFEKARDILAKAHTDQPNDPQAAFYYGVALEGLGDLPGAIDAYRKALALEPKLTEASQNLSAALVEEGDAQGALEVANAGLKHRPDDAGLLANRALALEAAGSSEALAAYAKALEKAPGNGSLRFNYASALAQADQREQAIAQLKKIPTDDPEFASAVATTFYQLKAFDECIAVLDKTLGRAPSADLHVRRGACRQGKDDKSGALSDYQTAVKLDGSFAPGHYYLGRLLAAQGKKAEARASLQKAEELGAGTPISESAKKALADLGK